MGTDVAWRRSLADRANPNMAKRSRQDRGDPSPCASMRRPRLPGDPIGDFAQACLRLRNVAARPERGARRRRLAGLTASPQRLRDALVHSDALSGLKCSVIFLHCSKCGR
jgi:hypothetical protein